jgi:hypothetical protein
MLTKDGILTLANFVIIDRTCVDLLPRSCTIQGFVASNATQAKERNYHDQHHIDQLLFLTIEIFGCLHKQAYAFLHHWAIAIWSLKGLENPPLFVLVTFLCQRISIILQRIQTSCILSQVMTLGLITS